ncbi:hypothetical protein [Xenorhabdus innexi]|uniref:Uncharacterized protein n=1 Tax=Xenorhabdus innexi TaxID=290109 RepID=A0A1N6N284_9GAMM|nr:hypothetical protein [Xenorhabdus innexi]PHM29431.1 hypothetical protein Xinn_03699 [Xenorhabdus innexi]SIP75142.1 conserved hypothetical protein [Xenorhabdus innexi]
MDNKNRIFKIKEECDKILDFHMWYNYPDNVFWPIINLMDVDDEDFLIEVYSSVSDRYLDILTDSSIILPIIESSQSVNLINYIKSISDKKKYVIDDILILDMESALFVNYEELENRLKAKEFENIYMSLKKFTIDALNKDQCYDEIVKTLDFIVGFSKNNKHEYFSYVSVYWLGLYLYNSILKFKNREEIRSYKEMLSGLFPCGKF